MRVVPEKLGISHDSIRNHWKSGVQKSHVIRSDAYSGAGNLLYNNRSDAE